MNEAKLEIVQLGCPLGRGCGCGGMGGAYKDKHGTTLAGDILRWFKKDGMGVMREIAGTYVDVRNAIQGGENILVGLDKSSAVAVPPSVAKNALNQANGSNDKMVEMMMLQMQSNQQFMRTLALNNKPKDDDDKKDNTGLYIGLGVGGVLLLMMMMMTMSKNK